MKKQIQINAGLRKLRRDSRDFNYTQTFGAVSLPTEDFIVAEPLEIKNQYSSDFCVAFAGSAVSEAQEGVILSPEWLFMKAKQITGNWQSWGLDLRIVAKALCNVGSIEKKDSPFELG